MTVAEATKSDVRQDVERVIGTLVVGAGLSGICSAIKLNEAGETDYLIIEQASAVGGTWRDNTYPGCCCDIPSPAYSFGFAPNSGWTRLFARQSEIQSYLVGLAETHGIPAKIEFQTELVDARWDAQQRRWFVTTNHDTFIAQALILATGVFPEPSLPTLPGLADFAGKIFHTARWDHDYDLAGKRVAVVGTGASALQLIPEIQPVVEHLTVCQRTPTWVLPKLDPRFRPSAQRLLDRIPPLQRGMRMASILGFEGLFLSVRFQKALGPLEAMGRWNIKRAVADPDLRKRLEPNFRIGCKRVSASNRYYPALAAANSTVAPAAAEVRPDAIVTADGVVHRVDAIIFATGFDVQAAPVFSRVHGVDGKSLAKTWGGTPEAYLTCFNNFPNLFMLFSPFSGVAGGGFNQAEIQSEYIVRVLQGMKEQRIETIEVRPDVQRRFSDEVHGGLKNSVWETGGCSSFYLDKEGRMTLAFPGSMWSLKRRMQRFDVESYETQMMVETTRRLVSA